MKKVFITGLILFAMLLAGGCQQDSAKADSNQETVITKTAATPEAPPIPPTLAEIEDSADTESESSLTNVDFKNYTYPLPRGWQDVDSKEISLKGGTRRMTAEKIGMSYVNTKYGDVTEDGKDEAFVILRVGTGGSATPHLVYIVEEKESGSEIIWYFRTGDRSDGGLKRVYSKDGKLVVELFGQDRYIFNQMETLPIIGDESQLCCPEFFTRIVYKKSANGFLMEGDRLTFSLTNPDADPTINLGEVRLKESRGKK